MATWTVADLREEIARYAGEPEPDSPKQKKRQRILLAAKDLFTRQGYRKTSIDEVSRAAAVAKGTVYTHFESKTHLLLAVVATEEQALLEKLGPMLDERLAPAERLRQWIHLMLISAEHMPLTARLMSGDNELLVAFAELEAEMQSTFDAMGQRFIGALIEEAAPGRFTAEELRERVTTLMGLAFFSATVQQPMVRSGLSADRYAEVLASMIVDGVVPAEPSS
jgi:AcrR family transcriptional regulator